MDVYGMRRECRTFVRARFQAGPETGGAGRCIKRGSSVGFVFFPVPVEGAHVHLISTCLAVLLLWRCNI